jgi:integrase
MPRKRKLPDGLRERNGAYYADFYAGGRRVRKRLSTQFDVAEQLLHELQARADRADFGLLDNDCPLAEIKAAFLKHCRQTLKPATAARYERCLGNILAGLGVTRAAQVRSDGVLDYRDGRLAEGATPRTVNMEVIVLGTMFRWAARPAQKLIASNPLAGLKPLPHDHAKEGRALTDDEVKRLLDSSPAPMRDVWYAFLVTGLRKAELGALTFRDIDWENREIIVRGGVAKNHRERRIPIDAGLWDILCRQRDGRVAREPGKAQSAAATERARQRFTRDHVFVTQANTPLDHRSNLYHAFLRCCEAAGIQTKTYDAEGRLVEHVDVHSLRRTFATNLIVSGADPKSVQELLGHRTLEMTMKIYTKIRSQTKRQALGRLSYGQGALAPAHVVEYPGVVGNPVQNGHRLVTSPETRQAN